MSSNLKVNTILPSTGTNVAIGTAGGTITMLGNIDIDINSGISTFNDIHISDKIVHDGDTNTSIRFPSSDTITFETNATERLRLESSGDLQFNNAESVIHTSADTSRLRIFGGSSNSTANGAALALHGVNHSAGNYAVLAAGNGGFIRFSTGATPRLQITSGGDINVHNTTAASTTDPVTLDLGGQFTANASITQANLKLKLYHNGSNGDAQGITASASGLSYVSSHTTDHIFYTVPSSINSLVERVRIASDGDFGIGTNNPQSRLEVKDNDSNNYGTTIRLSQGYNSVFSEISSNFGGSMTLNAGQGGGAPIMHFQVNDNEKMRITSTGELGVNTTAPVEKLGISGNMRFVNPNGTTSRITALPSGSYNTGTSGGSAVCFHRFADGGGGSDEIFFETHWQGNRHGESMRINKYGHVTTPNQPSFNVTITTIGQINSNAGVIIFNNTTSLGNHNNGNHYNASNGRFTAPVAGKYQFNARMLTNSSTTSYTIYLLRVNANHVGYIGHNHSDYWLMESGSFVLNLQANDYVDCYIQQHSGHGGHNYASFSGFLIG